MRFKSYEGDHEEKLLKILEYEKAMWRYKGIREKPVAWHASHQVTIAPMGARPMA